MQPKTFEVPVTGGVAYPAIFEIMDGETVNDVINFAAAFLRAIQDSIMLKLRDIILIHKGKAPSILSI